MSKLSFVEELEFSVKAYNLLRTMGIRSHDDFMGLEQERLVLQGVPRKVRKEIEQMQAVVRSWDKFERVKADVEPERIVAAAVRAFGLTISLPRPARHNDIVSMMHARGGIDAITHGAPDAQGFLTSAGRFVDREEAAKIAVSMNQVDEKDLQAGELFSEDVW